MKRVSFHTLGCKLNYAETATISQQFIDRGFRVVEFGEPADVCVINTCSVTNKADRECRQLIRKALRASPQACIVVVGCYAQLEPEEVSSIEGVDYVIGAKEKFDLFRYIDASGKRQEPEIIRSPIETATEFVPCYTAGSADRTRAYLKVQDGCDYQCAFCTIPLARGISRSQPIDATVEQARQLVRQGYREIVLTGVNVGDYGRKIGTNLLSLLRALEEVDGLMRIRISSIEPNLLTHELIEYVRDSEKTCPHFHIPLQSGSDAILKLMRRRYLSGHYRELIYKIKEEIPDAGIGADVIVGFPGETDAHFEETYLFLVELPLSYLHVFTYSERPNTYALKLPGVVEPRVRARRNEMLRILSAKKRRSFYEGFVGRVVPVLMEGTLQHDARGMIACPKGLLRSGDLRIGHTGHYVRVGVPSYMAAENDIVDVRIIGVDDKLCIGEIAAAPGLIKQPEELFVGATA